MLPLILTVLHRIITGGTKNPVKDCWYSGKTSQAEILRGSKGLGRGGEVAGGGGGIFYCEYLVRASSWRMSILSAKRIQWSRGFLIRIHVHV